MGRGVGSNISISEVTLKVQLAIGITAMKD